MATPTRDSMQVAIIIPALNEGGNIRRLVGEIPLAAAGQVRVIVVDNGSTDATATEAREAGAAVVSEPRRGYGYACAAGVAAASDLPDEAIAIFLDGDGSFDPAQIVALLEPLRDGQTAMVLGSRIRGGIEPNAMPPHQLFGNRMVSRLMSVLYRLEITDLAPYRAVRLGLLRSLDMREMTFGWPTEMMVKAANCRVGIVEVPVRFRKRWSGKSKVSGTVRGTLLATYYILGVTLRYALWR